LKKTFSLLGRFLRWTWKFFTTGVTVLSSLILLLTVGFVLTAALYQPETKVPDGAALVLAPRGEIVEQKSPFDPVTRLVNNLAGTPLREELLLQDVIDGIRSAAHDDRIKMLVLAPDHMGRASLDQIRDIGKAIESFKDSGKIVVAAGDSFNQGQYYLASWSDEIYLNPMGSVGLQGFGVYRLYMRTLLDKLAVNFHIFKVGTFKSALEPFTRDTMSSEARAANKKWLSALWEQYCEDIGKHRGIPARAVTNAVNRMADNMKLAKGSGAQMAINNGLVDGLKTREQLRDYLKELVGSGQDGSSFRQINLSSYLNTIKHSFAGPREEGPGRVGILVAQGNIVYGEAAVGQIGSDDLVKQLRRVRRDNKIKALVLRVDSGGGSAFASELIRRELLLIRKAGKPIVVSMGSMAASGAYWISADADKIFASPMTLTGSIGIFGALPTFEKSLARIGVFSDGTGTTELAGAGDLTRELPQDFITAMQSGVEYGYRQFLSIVAQGRKMDIADVERIAQGRVWDGRTAVRLGLVDELGNLEDAVAAAAKLAGLPPDSGIFLHNRENSTAKLLKSLGAAETSLIKGTRPTLALLDGFMARSVSTFDFLTGSDPRHMYSHCLLPGETPFF
jgi:protease-4